jgi:hypothetical protein
MIIIISFIHEIINLQVVNKGSHCFVRVDFLCHEQKSAISDGKQD